MSPAVWELAYEEKLTALHRHALQLGLANNIDEIANTTLHAMEFALGFDFADVTVVENGGLRVRGSRGARPLLIETPLSGRGVKSKAANTRKTLRISDTRKEPAYLDDKGSDWKGPPTMLSELAVPVVVDGESVAVLNVESRQRAAFSRDDQELLEILAFHVGSVFKRLKYEEKIIALHKHASLLRLASSIDEITKHTLDAMEFAIGFDFAEILVVETGRLKVVGMRGTTSVYEMSLNGPGIIARVANTKKSIRISDTRKDPDYVDPGGFRWKGPLTMLSEVVVPVMVDNEVRALLNIENTQLDAFSSEDQTLLEILASHVGSAMKRLKYENRLMALHWHAQNLASVTSIDQIVEHTLDAMTDGLGFDYANINFVENGRLITKGSRGAKSFYNPALPLDGPGVIVKAANQQTSIRVADTRQEPSFVDLMGLDWKGPPSTLSELAVPVLVDGVAVAVLNVESAKPDSFATEDQTLLETLAIHVGSSVRRLKNITDRRDAETEIRKLSQFLESIIDNASVWLNVLDQNSNVLTWNKAAEEISGYSRGEVVGHDKIWKWLYPDEQYRKEVAETTTRIIQNELHGENVETSIKRKDGQTRIISWNSRALFDLNHIPIGSVAIGRDITEQARLRQELDRYSRHLEELVGERTMSLQESQERLNTIIQASPEGIVVTDQSGIIVDCNPAALRHYTSREQLVGKKLIELIAGKDRDMASVMFNKIAEAGTIRDLGYTLCGSKGREFPAAISASVIKDAGGIPVAYIAIVKDLTEQNEIQERLRKAERMAVIGETAAMVGHDLRNPLQGISGAAYVLRQSLGSKADAQTLEMLAAIDNGLQYADKIVKELLDYSREIRLELSETDVKALVDAVLLQVKIPENVTVRNMTQATPKLLIDEAKTQRVFVNLTSNAIDAMPNGGELRISSTESNGAMEIKFADTGEGIPDTIMQNLWKPLRTTKSRGMGLGLAICKRILEAHGGSIEVESAPGKGTTFTIRLPIKPEARESILA